jgi:hypothetical protein
MNYEGSSFVYDERRKELKASKTWLIKGEEEIKKTLTELETQKKSFEDGIKKKQEILDVPELTPEQEKLKADLEVLQKYQLKKEKGKELEENLKSDQESVGFITQEINRLKEAIGSRLKL